MFFLKNTSCPFACGNDQGPLRCYKLPLMDAGISDATAPSVGDMGEQVRMCGVTRSVQSRPRCPDSGQRSRRLR